MLCKLFLFLQFSLLMLDFRVFNFQTFTLICYVYQTIQKKYCFIMRMQYVLHNKPFDSNATNSPFNFIIYRRFSIQLKKKTQKNYLRLNKFIRFKVLPKIILLVKTTYYDMNSYTFKNFSTGIQFMNRAEDKLHLLTNIHS